MKIVKILKTTLKSALATDGTTITVQQFVDSNGEEVALADFGSFFNVVIKQGSKIEIITCSGLTQSSTDDSAILTVATNGRAIPPKAPFTGSATGKSFQTGAELIVTNDPYTMSFFAQVAEDNAFTGQNTFTQFPKKLGSTTPVDDEDFVTLAHLNATVLGDAVVSAIKSSVTFGEAVTAGDPVYFKTSDQKWWRAYANNSATCVGVLLGIAQATADADEAGTVTRLGRDAINTGLTAGATIYLTDAGGLDDTAGSYIVELGKALATGSLDFNPKEGKRELFLSSLTGMIVPFAGDSVPSGFLACDGQLLNFSAQPDLLAVIGAKYGLGSGVLFTVTAANDTVDVTSHGYSNGQRFMLTNVGGALPAGLAAETLYYVVEAATNTFKLSLTAGGAAIDITGAGTGLHYLHTQFKVPDLRGSVVIGKGQKTVTLTVSETNHTVTSIGTITTVGSGTTVNSHGLTTGDSIVVTSPPTGLTANTQYYVRSTGANTFDIYSTYEQAITTSSTSGRITTSGATGGTVYKKALFTTLSDIDQILQTGSVVTLSSAGTLPSGLAAGTYYFIRVSDRTFRLATLLKNAAAGAGVSISNDGNSTSTIVFTLTSRTIGNTGGEETHTLTIAEMPNHTHTGIDTEQSDNLDASDSGGESFFNGTTGYTGGDGAHNNMQPYVVANWIIKT